MAAARVLLADDSQAMLALVRQLLEPAYCVVGATSDGRTLVREAMKLLPDALVIDISMPLLSGLEAARRLQCAHCPARIVFLTIHDDPAFVAAALAVGASGYVLKASAAEDLLPALSAALKGETFISRLPDIRANSE